MQLIQCDLLRFRFGFRVNVLAGTALVVFTLFVLLGCANTSVNFDYDPETDFTAIKSFAWQSKAQSLTGDPKIDNEINDKRFRSAVNSGLIAKGLTQESPDKAEIILSYQITIKPKLHNQSTSGTIGIGTSSHGSGVGISLGVPLTQNSYDEGTTILDMNDAKSKLLIWRGVAARKIDPSASAQENVDRIQKIVVELLGGYPPHAKK